MTEEMNRIEGSQFSLRQSQIEERFMFKQSLDSSKYSKEVGSIAKEKQYFAVLYGDQLKLFLNEPFSN